MDSSPAHARRVVLPAYHWFAAFALAVLIGYGLRSAWPRPPRLWDFGAFWLAGRAASRGLDPYSVSVLAKLSASFGVEYTRVNLNPPLSLLIFEPLSWLDPATAFIASWSLSLLAYVAIVGTELRMAPGWILLRAMWALSLGGLWYTLDLGQIYVLLLLLAWPSYRASPGRVLLPCVAAGLLVALKPHYGIWPCVLLAAGHRREGAGTLLAACAFWLLSLSWQGIPIHLAWLAALRDESAASLASNASWTRLLADLIGGFMGEWFAAVAGAALMLGLLWHAAVARPSRRQCADLSLTLATALSPVAWAGYTVLLLPALMRRAWGPRLAGAAALLALPANLLFQLTAHAPLHPARMLYPLALALITWDLLARPAQAEIAAAAAA